MMKTIKRWYANIKWLLNRPPTMWTISKNLFPCDYCGNSGFINIEDEVRVCTTCLKKALDKALKGGRK